jgi:hypothetical protein
MGTKFCFDIFVHRGAGAYIAVKKLLLSTRSKARRASPP